MLASRPRVYGVYITHAMTVKTFLRYFQTNRTKFFPPPIPSWLTTFRYEHCFHGMRYMIRALHTRIDLWTEPRFKNNPIRVHRATFLIIFIFFLKQAARALKVSERFSGASSRARRITLIKFDGRAETSSGLSRRPAFRERDLSSVSPDVCVCVCVCVSRVGESRSSRSPERAKSSCIFVYPCSVVELG